MVIPMMEDMIKKKADYLFERSTILEFVQRFLEIHQEKIMQVNPGTFDEVYGWLFLYNLETNTEIYNWIRMQKYKHKFWLNDELHLEYLRKEIADRSHKIQVSPGVDDKESELFEIYGLLKQGEFPDIEKYGLRNISIVMADLLFIDFLKEEQQRLLAANYPKTLMVPVELTTPSKTGEYSLQIKVPPEFFKDIQKEILHQELEKIELPKTNKIPEPKLYTREETAKLMNVSIGTIDNLTKDGTLKCHRIKGTAMKRYKWEDIDNALDALEMHLNKRFGK